MSSTLRRTVSPAESSFSVLTSLQSVITDKELYAAQSLCLVTRFSNVPDLHRCRCAGRLDKEPAHHVRLSLDVVYPPVFLGKQSPQTEDDDEPTEAVAKNRVA